MTAMAGGEPSQTSRSFEETRAFLHDHLGPLLPDSQMLEFHKIKMAFRERQSHLQNMVLEEEITKERYYSDFTEGMEEYMRASRVILGEGDFAVIYGQAGRKPGAIIDREVFFSHS